MKNDRSQLSRSRIYFVSDYKLQKLKKYLNNNLRKRFISFSYASYASLMLFAVKSNEDLRICVNYRKLNVIIHRNWYSILLIKKTLIKIIDCKYLIKLNVIIAFNKLRMYSDSEKLIIFIILMKVYKYYVLLFNLTNDSFNYQHYMNDMLWEFLNDFYSIYLDDILVYNKTYKKHVKHVRTML